jgi:hypothetical protein
MPTSGTPSENGQSSPPVSGAALDFLQSSSSNTSTESTSTSSMYSDFFDTSSSWTAQSAPQKPKKTPIEITVSILWYIISILIFILIILSVHVFLRTQERSTIAENYKFLCPYFNYDVDFPNKWCKTLSMIADEYNQSTVSLQRNIIDLLTAYIPVKVSKNIVDASPERAFIISTYANKISVIDIMSQFEKIKKSAEYQNLDNISCSGVSIDKDLSFVTQCMVYGWAFGQDGSDGKLASARIEALKFLDILWNTPKSQFRLLNPPSSLSVEKLDSLTWNNPPIFQTRTTVPLQLIYVPFDQTP